MEFWQDMKTGEHLIIEYNKENGKRMRSWTIRRGEKPVWHPPIHIECSHEWWSANGKYIYYCDNKNGIGRIDYETGETRMIYTPINSHAHATADDLYFCSDRFMPEDGGPMYRGCPTRTQFYNDVTGKSVIMITENPALYKRAEPCVYHIDPHPRFVMGDRYVAQVTTVTGQITVAFTSVDQLKALTK